MCMLARDDGVVALICLYERGALGALDVSFSLSVHVVEFPVHRKLRSLLALSRTPGPLA